MIDSTLSIKIHPTFGYSVPFGIIGETFKSFDGCNFSPHFGSFVVSRGDVTLIQRDADLLNMTLLYVISMVV